MAKAHILLVVSFALFLSSSVQETKALSLVKWPPLDRCGPTCAIACECGRVLDSRGCPSCTCKDCGPVCPVLECLQFIKCSNGVRYVNGCPTCSCNPPKCEKLLCKKACPFGYVTVNGCRTCQCKPRPVCPDLWCLRLIKCAYGMRYVNGCPTCSCNPPKCEELLCKKACPFGYVTVNGCRTCQCKPPPLCLDLPCLQLIKCSNGVKMVNGCPTCSCNPPKPLPEENPCGTKSICPAYLKCPFGYKIDSDGCRTCQCDNAQLS